MTRRLTSAGSLLRVLASWLFLLMAGAAHADHPIRFEHLSTAQGLPQNTVMATLQDSRGFMWFATEDGLARFDGYDFVRYARNRSEPDGLPSSFIWDVEEDANGDLWIAAKDGGVARWSRSTETFTIYRHEAATENSLSSDAARVLLIAKNGAVWIGTMGGGLNRLDPSTGVVTRFRDSTNKPATLAGEVITALHEDADGTIWVGSETGLHRVDPRSSKFVLAAALAQTPLATARISTIRPDGDGSLWVGTFNAGIHRLDRTRQFLTSWRATGAPQQLSSDEVRDALVDSTGRLWVATANGLNLLEPGESRFEIYKRSQTDPSSLPDNYVMSLHEDRSGLIWVGTRAGGVSRFNTRSWKFGLQTPGWLEGSYVMAFAEDGLGRLWVGTLGQGLRRYDPRTRHYESLEQAYHRKVAIPEPRVMSLLSDSRGGLWVGTMGRGVVHIAPNGTTERYESRPNDPESLTANGIMALLEDRDGRIWLGTFGGGVNIIDPKTRQVLRVPVDPNNSRALPAGRATALAEDEFGFVWVGLEGGGLSIVDPRGSVVRTFRHEPENPRSLGANTVYSLYAARDGRLWVGTAGGGLAEVVGNATQPAAIEFRSLTKEDGLAGDVVYGIHGDAQGMLWLSSDSGLTRYFPASNEFAIFRRVHGLQGDEFNFGAHFRTRSGEMCFGGPHGYNLFDPLDVQSQAPAPNLALTRVEVMNRTVASTPAVIGARGFTLDHDQRVIAFEFAALDFTAPALNRYRARLDGFDSEWTDLGHHRRISFTNLAPGNYQLQVRAANSDGVWSDTVLTMPIRMRPAPWLTVWAKLGYATVVALALWATWRAQRRKIENASRLQAVLEAEVATRTAELREQNHELARLSRAKSDFLSRMSHEIRTPLNGVIGTVDLLSRTSLSPRQGQLATTARSSAQLLLTIVNEILDLARVESGKIEIEAHEFDLGALLEEATSALAAQAVEKDIELIVAGPNRDSLAVVGDALRLRQVLLNLIGNALKFTNHGEVFVDCDTEPVAGERVRIRIDVRDTGIGMSPDVLEKIFDPFSQADESTTRRFGGTGLGLAICRELTQLMNGQLTVASEPGIGSTFTLVIELPLAKRTVAQDAGTLHGLCARIECRRPNLARSIGRQLRGWGIGIVEARRPPSSAQPEDVWIIDADTTDGASVAAKFLKCDMPKPALVILASQKTLSDLAERGFPAPFEAVAKPLQRQSLHDAIAAITGRLDESTLRTTRARPPLPNKLSGHVLLVEDSNVNAVIAESMLQEIGCTVSVVADGTLAVARAATEHFDLILMDRHMPTLDGAAATKLIRAAQRPGETVTPIIALTADTSPRQQEECRAAGMNAFLGKPFDLADLYAVLAQFLPAKAASATSLGDGISGTPDVIDQRALDLVRELDGPQDRGLLARLVTIYLADSLSLTRAIESAAACNDVAAIGRSAHALKSASANVGATEVSRLAAVLEELARHKNLSHLQSLVYELVSAQRLAAECLRPYANTANETVQYAQTGTQR